MLNEFIEKILVHERDRKGSIQTTQEVEIYFNFVGRFVPPAFGEVELTPEELEEIRKREERKDRLHQNYLKRKASGAQKRYEDKIKGLGLADNDVRDKIIAVLCVGDIHAVCTPFIGSLCGKLLTGTNTPFAMSSARMAAFLLQFLPFSAS